MSSLLDFDAPESRIDVLRDCVGSAGRSSAVYIHDQFPHPINRAWLERLRHGMDSVGYSRAKIPYFRYPSNFRVENNSARDEQSQWYRKKSRLRRSGTNLSAFGKNGSSMLDNTGAMASYLSHCTQYQNSLECRWTSPWRR